jgi:predicted ABC-type transport system involved in lysophospholipase L1 biosynthesis ATPase subunit
MVTHNRDFAARFGRCVALRDGRLCEKGSSD